MKYIAYGSNLSVRQMAYRCPGAKVIGKAVLKNWKLVFRTHATIEPSRGRTVPVLIWEISPEDEKRLDRYEGVPRYYVKKDMNITMTDLDGKNIGKTTAMAYIMTGGKPVEVPSEGYYGTLKEGYLRFGFRMAILERALDEAEEAGHGIS